MPNFSGVWSLQSQMQAIAAGTWTGLPPVGLFTWGYNNSGQLGLNDTVYRSSPVQVGEDAGWAQVSTGRFFSTAIKTNGQLWSWGRNTDGQLGLNDTNYRSSPVQIGALTDWSQVSAGEITCAAIKTNSTLWAWGSNYFGQLGQTNTIYRSSPVQVGALTDWTQVSAGASFCAAVKTNGTLWSWGYNGSGQLGQNIADTIRRSSPVQVGALTDWSQVSAGYNFCAAVKTNGTLWSWGRNDNYGQLGQGNVINRSSPVQVGALTDWAQVSIGNDFCAAVKTNGTLWTWGRNNNHGQLGQGNVTNRSSPVQVGALTDWAQVASGNAVCRSVKTNGTLWTWGNGAFGSLGQNNTISRSSPVQVGALTSWSGLNQGATSFHTAAITS